MDKHIAARALGVAAYTIETLEPTADGWYATVRDMSTHVRTRRPVPGASAPVTVVEVEVDGEWQDVTEHRVVEVDVPPARPAKAAPSKKAPPKARKAAR